LPKTTKNVIKQPIIYEKQQKMSKKWSFFTKFEKLKGIRYSSLENRFSHAHFGIPPPMIRNTAPKS